MIYRFNKIFREKLGADINIEDIKPNCNFHPNILNDSIIEDSGCYFLQSIYTGGVVYDKTGTEVLHNKILISDYLEENSENDIFICAIGYAVALAQKISNLYTDNFKVVLTSDENFVAVYFYKIRENEPYLSDDLDDYKIDGVLTIDTRG